MKEKDIALIIASIPFTIMYFAYLIRLEIMDMVPGYYYMGCE